MSRAPRLPVQLALFPAAVPAPRPDESPERFAPPSRAEVKAAAWAEQLVAEGWSRPAAIARARSAYGLTGDSSYVSSSVAGRRWARGVLEIVAGSRSGAGAEARIDEIW